MSPARWWGGWLSRLLLAPSTLIFFGIAFRHILHPAAAARAQGLLLASPSAETVVRAGFGGFPLACALYLLACLVSRTRVLTGLVFSELAVCTILAIRIGGMLADHAVAVNLGLVKAEVVLAAIDALGIALAASASRREAP